MQDPTTAAGASKSQRRGLGEEVLLPMRNTRSYNAMMRVYLNNGQPREALWLRQRLRYRQEQFRRCFQDTVLAVESRLAAAEKAAAAAAAAVVVVLVVCVIVVVVHFRPCGAVAIANG